MTGQELRTAVRALLLALDAEHERRPLQKSTTSLMSRVRHLAVDPPVRFDKSGTVIRDGSS